MKGKTGLLILIVAVAAAAFAVGWWYRSGSAPAEEMAQAEPPARPRRPAAPARTASAAPAEPPAPASPVSEAKETGVRPAAPQPVELRLAQGTKIVFSLNQSLSTKTNQVGDPFSGVVTRSVRVGERIAIPEGSTVLGSVAHVERAGRVKGRSELGLRFEHLELPGGETLPLNASLTDLGQGEKESVTEEGQVKGEGTKTRDAVTIGGGAGIGTAIGAIAGGGKGAAIGAGAGAAAGTAMVLLTRGKDIELARGSELALQLDRPLVVRLN